jgi:2-amino-4-hydroxy-6-hydroxymethyldihydropteridine diphosphokinase
VTEPVVIGFGGNVGTETAILERFSHARAALAELGRVRSAPVYRSAPIGPAQPAYLNTAVALALADAQPLELVATLQELERLLGRNREREVHWGPRPIDLDVLVWGTRQLRTTELEVPHPRLGDRKFALAPLVALLGDDFAIPGLGAAGALLAGVSAQSCDELAAKW